MRPHTGEVTIASLTPGQRLPDRDEYVSTAVICQLTATTGDWYPGHCDPAFALRQGQPAIFLSTLHLHALIDKYVLDMFGEDTFIHRRRMRIRSSVYAESHLRIHGDVVSVDAPAGRATIALVLECDGREPVTAEVDAGPLQ